MFESYELIQPFIEYNQFQPSEEPTQEEQLSLTNLIDNIKYNDEVKLNNDIKQSNDVIQLKLTNPLYLNYTSSKRTTLKNNLQTNYVPTKGEFISRQDLSRIMDEQGITGEKKSTLLKIASRESNFRINATNKYSSASGLWQMTDSTRKGVSNISKQEFLRNPIEQVKAASRLYDYNARLLRSWNLPVKGENIALTWLNPTWAKAYLTTGKNIGSDAFGTTPSSYLQKFRNTK